MKKLAILPLIAFTALGLSACTKHSETDNVTVNETSVNSSDTGLEAPATDANATDNAAGATLDNSTNSADALTNS